MKKPTIILDCDGILADLYPSWLGMHNRECQICTKPITADEILSWDTHRYVECQHDIYLYLRRPEMWASIQPIEGSQAGVAELLGFANLVVATTITSGRAVRDARVAWLRRHFPMLKNIVITDRKACIRGDLLFDDAIHNLLAVLPTPGLLMDYAHNRWSNVFMRVTSWPTGVAYMREMFL